MFREIAILSVLASTALAQSNSTSSNPLIPSGISSGCSSFLTSLNSDSSLASCLTPITTALAAFGPGSNSSTDSSTVSSALSTLCGDSTSTCSDSDIRTQITNFYSSCTAELTSSSPNPDVARTYDVLYTISPLRAAVCTKSDSGSDCVTSIQASPSNISENFVKDASPPVPVIDQTTLWTTLSSPFTRRQSDSNTTAVVDASPVVVPNITTFQSTNIVFLFLNPNMTSSTLCQSCTRNVMNAYTSFEAQVPYGPGLGQSILLGGQSALYSAIESECGASFLSSSVQAAGGISSGLLGSGAMKTNGGEFGAMGSLLAAVALGFIALL